MAKAPARGFEFPKTAELMFTAVKRHSIQPRTPHEIGRDAEVNTFVVFYSSSSSYQYVSYTDNNHIVKTRKQKQVILLASSPAECEAIDRKRGIVPDGILDNKLNGNKVYVEVKSSKRIDARHIKDWCHIANRYNILKQHVLIVIQGKGATKDKINELNFEIAKKGLYQYALAVHIDDFPNISHHWSNQINTNLETLKKLNLH